MDKIAPLKIQTNIAPKTEKTPNLDGLKTPTQTSFSDHMMNTFETVAKMGHEAETISTTSTNTTELAMAMDQFLVELDALKALVSETRKSIDRIFQESKA